MDLPLIENLHFSPIGRWRVLSYARPHGGSRARSRPKCARSCRWSVHILRQNENLLCRLESLYDKTSSLSTGALRAYRASTCGKDPVPAERPARSWHRLHRVHALPQQLSRCRRRRGSTSPSCCSHGHRRSRRDPRGRVQSAAARPRRRPRVERGLAQLVRDVRATLRASPCTARPHTRALRDAAAPAHHRGRHCSADRAESGLSATCGCVRGREPACAHRVRTVLSHHWSVVTWVGAGEGLFKTFCRRSVKK